MIRGRVAQQVGQPEAAVAEFEQFEVGEVDIADSVDFAEPACIGKLSCDVEQLVELGLQVLGIAVAVVERGLAVEQPRQIDVEFVWNIDCALDLVEQFEGLQNQRLELSRRAIDEGGLPR